MSKKSFENGNIKIAVDLMGGDFAPDALIEGCLTYLRKIDSGDVDLFLVAAEEVFQDSKLQLAEFAEVRRINCGSYVMMQESPWVVKKEKKDSSIIVCMELLGKGEVDVVYSAGHSGASVLSAVLCLGMSDGVKHPAILSFVKLAEGRFLALADSGASANKVVNSAVLLTFAEIANYFCSNYFAKVNPAIGLLNIGSEPSKGTEEHQKAFALLSESDLNFIGNIESDKMFNSDVDIIITDGFTGNIVLKLLESFHSLLKKGTQIASEELPPVKYEEIGGAPLLGVNGRVIIAHGKTTMEAVVSGLELCYAYASFDINQK